MSEEVGTDVLGWAKTIFGAWNTDGAAGFAPFFAEEAEWHDAFELPDAAICRGRDAIAARLHDWEPGGAFELKFEVEDALTKGDRVLVSTLAHGVGAQSRTPSGRLPVYYVYLLRHGQIARADCFLDRDEALEAAGLSE